jgi:hypothetical protein
MSPFLTTLGGGSVRGFGRAFRKIIPGPVQGQQAYTTAGTYAFTVPANVTSVSMVCVGGGKASSVNTSPGAGGSLAYTNNYSVSPAQLLYVTVGGTSYSGNAGNSSRVALADGTTICRGSGGDSGVANVGDNFYTSGVVYSNSAGMGGAGVGGYSANGGAGSTSGGANGGSSSGGGGGGGGSSPFASYGNSNIGYTTNFVGGGGGGGGVNIVGAGSNGVGGSTGGSFGDFCTGGSGGGGGSSGNSGITGGYSQGNVDYGLVAGNGGDGGQFGGGGGSIGYWIKYDWDEALQEFVYAGAEFGANGLGANGAVRIIWGPGRSYPSAAANV